MMTDNDIRTFMHDNRPALSGSDAFMAEFKRGTELLPSPAAFREDDSLKRKDDSEFIASFFEAVKIRKKRMTVLGSAAVVAASAAAAVLLSFVPDSWFGFLELLPQAYISPMTARYLLTGFLVMSIVALAGRKIYSYFSQIFSFA